jgi:integrase
VALSATMTEELRSHRRRQAEALLAIGVRLTDDHHVVTQADGTALQPNSIGHAFAMFLEATNRPHIRFHDLRHSHATQMLAAGVHPKIASERLGHAKVGTTLDLYSHVLPGMQADAAARVDVAIRAALEQHRKPIG